MAATTEATAAIEAMQKFAKSDNRTTWDVAQVIKAVADALEKLPFSPVKRLDDVQQNEFASLMKTMDEALQGVAQMQQKLLVHDEQVVIASGAHYDTVRKAHSDISKKIAALPELPVPYCNAHQMRELLDIAERCDRLSDEQWQRVIELARAMAKS